mgnify:CR=1 FL=1
MKAALFTLSLSDGSTASVHDAEENQGSLHTEGFAALTFRSDGELIEIAGGEDAPAFSKRADFFFQVVFVATATSIISGAVAERMKLWSFLLFCVVMTGFIYPVEGYWSWGGGFLKEAGFSDFAGSGIVHLAGAAAATCAGLALWPGRLWRAPSLPACWTVLHVVFGLWLLALLSALVIVLTLLATRRYGFVWETTILSGATFVNLTQALGALPALLGFSVPSEAMIRASGDAALNIESARQAWAAWLVGVLLVYGIVPRLLLTLLCLWRWKRGRGDLRLDLNLPGYAQLRERLMPSSERLGVSDAAPQQLHQVEGGSHGLHSDGALLVGIELDDQRPWPPALPKTVKDAGILDSRESRQKLLEQLTRFPPARLLIACDPRRSPDRGSLALIAELARNATASRVWLLQAPAGQALDAERLGDWHAALEQLGLPFADCAPMNWLESGHD